MPAGRERGGKGLTPGWIRRALRPLGPEHRDAPGTVRRTPEREGPDGTGTDAREEPPQGVADAQASQASLDQVLRRAAEAREREAPGNRER
jgi:hypothetical protein